MENLREQWGVLEENLRPTEVLVPGDSESDRTSDWGTRHRPR